MEENDDEKHSQGGQMFENFVRASTCKGTIQAFNILTCQLELDPLDNRNFYTKLKSKVTSWKAKALWNKLDKRASHKEYKRGRSCLNTKCLIVGGGPCGLRTAIELAFLGAKVVVVEKRDTFSRNNVLHLWPFTIHDLRGLGAKKFYGKFCGGSIDHISIQQLQLILFKVALLLGIEIHVNVEFVKVLEPPEDQENQKRGWRAEFLPMDHPLSEFEFNVVIGADGRRNTLEGFRRKEFRGKLAIAITANFINRNTAAEAKVEEISGVAFIFNQKFFQDLKEETGIDLENIVYYKDNTHYFVMTAKKQSLLDKGVIINDYIDTEMLLSGENVNQDNLLSYAREAADFATKYQLPSLDFAINHYGQPDVAMFDFTSMYASENAALLRERHRHQLLVALVGDSLLEPFWPMGTGCARGFLAAFDTAWMVRSWDQGKPPLEILAERESIYRLLPQTTPENINKNFDQYTIDPGTRYPNLNSSCVRPHQVRHLYIINELQQCPLERVSSIRKSVNVSRHESDIRPNKLLTWCQKQTEGYRNVNVTDLTASWRSGLALCAIMHRFRPDLIDFDSLKEEDVVENNQLVFDMAERELGIPPVTTGKEMASAGEPDKLSMVMYLSKFYELFRGTPLRAVDAVEKQNGKNDLCSAKSSNRIFNNYINFTLPRKRVPKVERREENDMNKRRRKGLGDFEEASSFSSRGINSGKYQGDREGMNQNKVKSMATQLLAKFEENAPNTSLRRQELVDKPALLSSSDPPANPRFIKPKEPSPSPPLESQAVARTEHVVREPKQSLHGSDGVATGSRMIETTDMQSRLSETLASTCPAAFVISGVLKRLQRVEEKINQKRAQSIANREFHKKNIKEKAAHLASMFGDVDLPKNKLPNKGLACYQAPTLSCLPAHDSTATSSSSSIPLAYPAVQSSKMTVGKVSCAIGVVAEVLVNLYVNDHRPKPQVSSSELGSLRKEFPRTIGGSDICYFCKKRVYVMERLSAEGHFFHRECFKCTVCSSTLRLTIYAFDVEEGKFYCKPHFTRCKTSNKYRKRPSMLKMQEKVETEMWTQEEPKHPDTTTESTSSTVSGPEDRPPDYYFRIADEPTSPKKPKNAPEHNFESRCSALSSNWTSVRIIPEEEMTEHDLLAVRVMVTSDGSSSELESDFYGDSSNSEIREGQFWLPEPVSYTKLLSKHASQTPSSMKEEERREKSKAADALQRANSFHSSTLNKYQNWRRKMQSNFPLLYIKRAGLHSQESSARSPSALEDDISQSQLTSHNKPPEITRGLFKSSIPVFQRKAKAKETPEEICRYVPHYPLQNSVTESPLMHSGNVPSVADVHKDENGNKEYNLDNLKEREECTTRTRDFSRKNTDLSSLDPEKNERSPRQWREQPDLEIKKQIKNKLMLDVEQQSKLLDLRNADLNGTKLEYQSQGMLEISEWKDIDGNRRKDISKQSNLSLPLPFANDALPNSSADTKEILKSSDSFVEECLSSHPKSPLRLIANAIKRSVLEPLVSHSESTKKTPDSNANLTSEHNFFSSSNTLGHTVPSRENNSNREHDVQSQESNVLDTQHLVTNPSSLSTEALFPVSSLHTGFSKAAVRPQNSSDEKMDDVPRLLEKFNLEETPLTASTDDLCICNQENLFSSLRLKNKISKDILGVPAQMNDMCLVFSNFTPQMDEKEKNHSLKSSVCFSTNFPHPKVLNNSSTDEDSGSEHLSVKKQVVVCCCSSSDGEFEHKPPLVLKAKRTLKRRKLEKETKQLAKQEELKRLHKAQAIQRQLEEVEERQRALEINGVKLERELRGESDSGTQDETQLLHEWFELVLEKNKLIRYESELLIVAQELELEDHQRRLEQKLREKMAFHDSLKDEQELNEEHEIFTELIKVVEERDKLVSSLEEQRVKEKADNQQFESFILSKGYQLSRT
ncbi:F-actin-monooxygenase MICAL2 isoform X3 [Pelodiscus sinensis]|uniref:F-actin-monooxygenase MICAL2 isoform X3 n=1 Tax=Pelodiscus sinensis TaxID=13735 RepID=UPI003F6D74CF